MGADSGQATLHLCSLPCLQLACLLGLQSVRARDSLSHEMEKQNDLRAGPLDIIILWQ